MVVYYLDKIGVKLELEPMDYTPFLGRMMKHTHSEGVFINNDYGNPYAGIRKSFVSGQPWNLYMMSDPYIDKNLMDVLLNPKLTEKQGLEVIKKLAIYTLEQAPAIILPTEYVYHSWWPWVQNFYGEFFVGAQRSAPIYARLWIDQEMKKKMGY
jgi:peptide/nickel transport system substrate-binding protein